jgi:hypothetical protein
LLRTLAVTRPARARHTHTRASHAAHARITPATQVLPDLLAELDAMSDRERLLALVQV